MQLELDPSVPYDACPVRCLRLVKEPIVWPLWSVAFPYCHPICEVYVFFFFYFHQQLEQSQKEASDLLEQNRLLQDQLRVALGREQSAREGYVLQVGWAAAQSSVHPGASV